MKNLNKLFPNSYASLSFISFHLFQILAEELFQFIKWYKVTLATIVEIAMRGIGDDEQLFVL